MTPGIPGDSGAAFLDASGKALGVLSTVAIAPLAGSNGVGDVGKELAYANSTGGLGVTLAPGTEAFTGPLLPIWNLPQSSAGEHDERRGDRDGRPVVVPGAG